MADDAQRATAIVLDAVRRAGVLRAIAREALARVEQRRGAPYSREYSFKLIQRHDTAARALVSERITKLAPMVCDEVNVPIEPTTDIEAYERCRTGYEMRRWRQKIDSSTPPPPKLDAVEAYESACERFVSAFYERAARAGCDWQDPAFQAGVAAEIATAAAGGARARPMRSPRQRQRGSHAKPAAFLAGDQPALPACRETEEADAVPTLESVEAAARTQLGVALVFGEQLPRGSENAATRARRSEGSGHRRDVATIVGLLRRLGYAVYPGDVGIDGVYAMADLVAYAGNDVLFVECLSKASIKQRAHERKLVLAERVPFCFVGALPKGFVADLPPSAYAIPRPNSAKMSNGQWVPYFWRRDRESSVALDLHVRRGRRVTKIAFAMPTLRLAEDVAGFIHAAMCSNGLRWFQEAGWEATPPRYAAIGNVPFERIGLAYSSFRLTSEASDFVIRLGRVPLVAELRGTDAGLDLMCQVLRDAGFVLNVVRAPG